MSSFQNTRNNTCIITASFESIFNNILKIELTIPIFKQNPSTNNYIYSLYNNNGGGDDNNTEIYSVLG